MTKEDSYQIDCACAKNLCQNFGRAMALPALPVPPGLKAYVCVRVYARLVCLYVYTHRLVCAYVCTHRLVCAYVCTHRLVCLYVCTQGLCVRTCVRIGLCVRTCVRIGLCVCTCVRKACVSVRVYA